MKINDKVKPILTKIRQIKETNTEQLGFCMRILIFLQSLNTKSHIMLYELNTIMGADEIDMNYNEILSEYKESICRKSSEPPSPTKIRSTLSEGGSPLMGKQAI